MRSRQPWQTLTLSIWLSYLFFVIYGSLAPLDFRPLPLEEAWAIFQHIPMYKLGVESRADWIANGVLYVPVGFLTAHLLIQKFTEVRRATLFILAGLFSITLAFGIEFSQIFFPPRTVSQNDLLAEGIGSLIGLVLAARYSDWFKALLHSIFSEPRTLALRLAEAYLAGYIAFSLFPFDLLLSGTEIEQKIQGDNWGWLLAGDPQGNILIIVKLLSEIALTLPFGLFLGYRSKRQSATLKQAAWSGLLLGCSIEIAQFFTASGVSQGFSVLTRIVGVCGGLAMWTHRANWTPEKLAALLSRYALPLATLYLLALLQVNGWFSRTWNGPGYAAAQLDELHFLPFYYHYFTTEAKALFSLASVCLMYVPIGLLTWSRHGLPSHAFLYALFLASIVETGKLFLQDMHPDPTNIMLGALSSWAVVHIARQLSNSVAASANPKLGTELAEDDQHQLPAEKQKKTARHLTVSPLVRAVMFATLIFATYWAATFPTQPMLLSLFLLISAATIWRRPALIICIIPAALPILDLAPWSGRFFFDEFDLLILISLAIGYTRLPPIPKKELHTDPLFTLAVGLLALSFAISAIRGLIPWHMPDANAFSNYYSPFNALRIAKGALWAFLLYGVFARIAFAGHNVARLFAFGMTGGLTGTILVVIWERFTFPGLFNFTDVYRVTGPFSQMHVGGADIETYLTIGAPFLVMLLIDKGSMWLRIALGLILLGVTYSIMVTFSRVGYAGYGVALGLAVIAATRKRTGEQNTTWLKRGAIALALSLAIFSVAIPIYYSPFAQERMALVGADLDSRQNHWRDALKMRDPGWATALFGMGIGRYPETHFWRSEEKRAAPYWLGSEAGKYFLRLGAGSPLYLEQFVSIQPGKEYSVEIKGRSNKPNAQLTISICEKWLLTSDRCSSEVAEIKGNGAWQPLQIRLVSGEVGQGPWHISRPVKFSLYNTSSMATIDLDSIRMTSDAGQSLLANGAFSHKLDHWFFTVDNDPPWHIWSMPVAVLFDQGWLGVIASCLLVVLVLTRSGRRALGGDIASAGILAAMAGVLVIAMLDTLIDSPRILLLLLLLAWLGATRCRWRQART